MPVDVGFVGSLLDPRQFEASLSLMLAEMEGEIDDRFEFYMRMKYLLGEFRAYSLPIPGDILDFEQELDEEFAARAAEILSLRADREQRQAEIRAALRETARRFQNRS